jgi:adenylyltransferase/sulfurtransferase
LFTPADIGGFKVEAGAKRLASMNPEIVIEPIASYLERTNIVESLTDIDVVVDGTDTVGARLLLNRALVTAQIPVIFGGATGWNGYVLPCIPNGPCYECVWTHPAERSCEEAGVLGPLVGTVGAAQAGEVIRTILGISEPGRLTLFDALRGETRTLRVKRRRDCSGCGDA